MSEVGGGRDAGDSQDVAPQLRAGTRITCGTCGTDVIVVKAPATVVRCCQVPMTIKER